MVGNKTDLYEKEVVSEEEGKAFADKINAIFILTSAKDNTGINDLFQIIGEKYIKKMMMAELEGLRKMNKKHMKNSDKDRMKFLEDEEKKIKLEAEKRKKEEERKFKDNNLLKFIDF